MDFPALESAPADVPAGLADALGAPPVAVYRNRHDLLVELPSANVVRALDPDVAGVTAVDVRAVVVTALPDDDSCDFVSRCFAPRVGVPEDPVTGSAHCALAPFWGTRLGRDDLVGAQLSSRGGIVQVRVRGDRVHLGGAAVTVLRGELLSPPR
jgi:predicted PhzF superfamily epimerase YddE/YHI9